MEERNESQYSAGEKHILKPNELRIGNILMHNGRNVEVESIRWDGIGESVDRFGDVDSAIPYSYLEPIPLTKKRLNSIQGDESFRLKFVKSIAAFEVKRKYTSIVGEEWIFITNCRYVHQLQNLYHALTGEELKIK